MHMLGLAFENLGLFGGTLKTKYRQEEEEYEDRKKRGRLW